MAAGRLLEIIAEHRADGLSWNAIAARLFADFGIETTGTTVAVWAQTDEPTEAAS